jgi:molybdopterin synthase sulfur carrier subunit
VIKLVYLARLRAALGRATEDLDLPVTVRDVGALLELLRARGGEWAHELAPGRALRVAVNHEMAQPETRLGPGDEVALFPPVTGG